MPDQYSELLRILILAYFRAATGKGHERHGSVAHWENQHTCLHMRRKRNIEGALFQIGKKLDELERLPTVEAKIKELLDMAVYACSAVKVLEEWRDTEGTVSGSEGGTAVAGDTANPAVGDHRGNQDGSSHNDSHG